jgi:hypothetical protein
VVDTAGQTVAQSVRLIREALRVGHAKPLDCITMPTPSTRVNSGCLTTKRLGRKESDMMIIGVDYHPSFSANCILDGRDR